MSANEITPDKQSVFSHFAKKSNNLDFPERRIPVITLISDVPDPFQRV